MKQKKIPLRKCVITNEHYPKSELIRIVRTSDGVVSLDLTGKLNGRGAYLKKDITVIKKAIKTKKLERHLNAKISEKVYEELLGVLNE